MTDRVRYWRRLVDAWNKSGLSQAEFCRRRRIKPVTFGWWKRKLKGAQRKVRHSVDRGAGRARTRRNGGFVEVALPGSVLAAGSMSPTTLTDPRSLGVPSTGPCRYEIALGSGRVIRLPQDFDPGVVSQLIAVVESC